MLDPQVTYTADGGGRAIAARRPLHGARRVAAVLEAFNRMARRRARARRARERRGPACSWSTDGDRVTAVLSLTVDAGRIVAVDVVRNPDKLRRVRGA